MTAADRDPPVLPPGLRERVLAASLRARDAGRPVPDAPEISAAEAFSRAASAFYAVLCVLDDDHWRTPVLRDLDVQGLVGHLIGVEHDVHRALAGDPDVADANHVESTQAAAVGQGAHPPARTRAEWRRAADRTLDLPKDPRGPRVQGTRGARGRPVRPAAAREHAAGRPGLRAVDARERHPAGGRLGRVGSRPVHAAPDDRSRGPAAAAGRGRPARAGRRPAGPDRARRRDLGRDRGQRPVRRGRPSRS